jgi:TonB family protein
VIDLRPLILAWLLSFALRAHTQDIHPASQVPGHLISHFNPVYPDKAKSRGIQGRVKLRLRILADGSVEHVTVLSGPPELQVAAQSTVYQWRYTPWLLAGQPVEANHVEYVSFSLPDADGKFHPYAPPAAVQIDALMLTKLLVRSYPPKLPKEAKRQHVFGSVKLHVIIDDTGAIVDLGVVSGPELLEDAALDTVRHWIYQPYLMNGRPTAVSSEVNVNF